MFPLHRDRHTQTHRHRSDEGRGTGRGGVLFGHFFFSVLECVFGHVHFFCFALAHPLGAERAPLGGHACITVGRVGEKEEGGRVCMFPYFCFVFALVLCRSDSLFLIVRISDFGIRVRRGNGGGGVVCKRAKRLSGWVVARRRVR